MSKVIVFTTESASGLQSTMDLRFGRAKAFVLVDMESGEVINEIENNSRDAAHGAGIATAAMIASQKVSGVVSGRFGPKAYEALSKLNVPMWTLKEECTVSEALSQLKNGHLEQQKVEVFT
ncbi:MAG: NifB/NifX family molybdenum-iron cluster-binding protein [Deltaproteobacteria bacterium]|nr:NifB/NifX family molybdenum-iron cluster-binding protein [Deltaproteobacteria bacterium]MBN2672104.1 NifB/NifX family molybdenum-iron cluster-binding protein [Deltaproteobacteria bacterium]